NPWMLSWSWCPTCWNCWEGRPSTCLPVRSRMFRLALVTFLCSLLLAQQSSRTQQQPPQQPPQTPPTEAQSDPKFGTTVDYVVAPVLVFDRDDNYVSGIRKDQFRLFDNGKEQNIQVDETFVPISLVIAIQAN